MEAFNLNQIIAAAAEDASDMEASRHATILAALKIKGYSLGRVSRELGLCRGAAKAIRGRRYPIVEAKIAEVLGCHPAELWPERYNADGTPKRERPNAAMTRPALRKERPAEAGQPPDTNGGQK